MGHQMEVVEEAFKITNTLMQPRSYTHLNQREEFFGNWKDKLKKPSIGNYKSEVLFWSNLHILSYVQIERIYSVLPSGMGQSSNCCNLLWDLWSLKSQRNTLLSSQGV